MAVPNALVPPSDRTMAVPTCLLLLLGLCPPLAVAEVAVGLAVPLAGRSAAPVVGLAVPLCSVPLVAMPTGHMSHCSQAAAVPGDQTYTQAVP